MYSLGVVLWELWSGMEPWAGVYGQSLYQAVIEEKKTLALGEGHRNIAHLLRDTFSFCPEHRPSIKQVYILL